MNYKTLLLKLIKEIKYDTMKGLGFSLNNTNEKINIDYPNIEMYKKNINFLYKIKNEININHKVWTKEMFNGYINTIDDGIINNSINDEITNKYIMLINEYKNMACIENI